MPGAAPGMAARPISFERERGVYDVRVTPGLALIVANVGDGEDRTENMQRAFRALASHSIPIFLIKLHRSAITFAVNEALVPKVEGCLQSISITSRVRKDLALITVIASSMRDLTGVMVSIADSLQASNARLYGTGDSHNSVQCLIGGAHVDASVKQLRETFGLADART
jgi:aspartate kinase